MCASYLKLPNVSEAFEYTGERVKSLSGQSPLYVRSLYPLVKQVKMEVLFIY